MNHIYKMLTLSAVTLLLAACGGGGSSPAAPSPISIIGQVQQGNVKDAQVFLDLNGNGVLDTGEPKAASLTDANGNFTLLFTSDDAAKITASSKIVSIGGTDTLNPAVKVGLLVSDLPSVSGSSATKHITPMTTLLAMAPDDSIKSKLKDVLRSLGLKDDALIDGSTQAVIALAKSVETVLTTLQVSVTTKAGEDVSRDVVRRAATEMGKAISGKTSDDLRDTEKLSNTLSFAAGTAVEQIPATQLDVHVADLVTEIKKGCLNVANAVKGSKDTLETTGSHSEAEFMTDDVKGQITNAVNTAITNIEQEVGPANTIITTTKTATVAFRATSQNQLATPLQGVTLTSILPVGTTVATDAGTTAISSQALAAGSGISGLNKILFGTYSAAVRKVRITFATTENTFTGGEIAKLVVSFQSPPALTAANFAAPTLVQAAGYDLALHSTVDLTSKLQAALGVTFN